MSQFIQYSLESAICLAVLLLPYLVWFRKTTFHQWNRSYLLGAILFSLSAPLLDVEIETSVPTEMPNLVEDLSLFEGTPQIIEPVSEETRLSSEEVTTYTPPNNEKAVISERETHWGLSEILTAIYFLGFLIFTSLFLFRFAKLFWLIRNTEKNIEDGSVRVHLSGKQVFSFFNYVFFDQDRYRENELETLLRHERVHIQQKHSWDVLALEILQVIFWFNPLYRSYKKLLQQEHEYFVDATTSKEIGQPRYAQLLLSLATTKQPVLGHAFAYVPVKHRIFKLFQKPSTTMEKSRFFIALPIVFSLFLVFSCSFDELEEIGSNTPSIGNQVRSVQAYFVDDQSALKQEIDVGSMELNEDGTIANLEMKAHPVFGSNFPNNFRDGFLWKENAVFFRELTQLPSLSTDFYSKKAQWLLAGDSHIHLYNLGYILYHKYGLTLFNIEKSILSGTTDRFDFTKTAKVGSNTFSFRGEKEQPHRRIFTRREMVLDDMERVTNFSHYKKVINNLDFKYNTGNTLMDSVLNAQKRTIAGSETLERTEMKYSEGGLLNELSSSFSTQSEMSDGKKVGSPKFYPNGNIRFFYNEQSHLEELHLINDKGMFLRKYRFHYNEAGYCIKKECINREGSVEFSVRFDYEFFDT